MRRGFTMIELIFVIVIIGILAAVAVPRMSATRDDAKVSAAVASAKQALNNLMAEYTATGTLASASITAAEAATPCVKFAKSGTSVDRVIISYASNENCTISSDAATRLKTDLYNAGLTLANGAAKTHIFGGSQITR